MLNVDVPLIFFIFRRPKSTKKVLDKLKKVSFKKIYVVCDGWRDELEKKNVLKVRKLISIYLKKKNLRKLYFDKNIGVRNIAEIGLNWVFKSEKKVIIIEDDTLPDLSFFKFCAILLKKYNSKKKYFND